MDDDHTSMTDEALAELYVQGAVCDSGRRRDGAIIFVLREHCDRCSGQGGGGGPRVGVQRLPCDDDKRDRSTALFALRFQHAS